MQKNRISFLPSILALMVSSFFLGGCSNDSDSTKKPDPKKLASGGHQSLFEDSSVTPVEINSKITVVDQDSNPIDQAYVLVGENTDLPFTGNAGFTNSQGEWTVPASWKNAEMVTVVAKGFTPATYLEVTPQDLTVQMALRPQKQRVDIKGLAQGIQTIDKDGRADFAFVLNTFRKEELFNFGLNRLKSPVDDLIKVAGKSIYLPSNVSLPYQKEKYSLLTLTLDKPIYTLPVYEPGHYKLYASRGQFDFETVVDHFRAGKDFLDALNYFRFLGGGFGTVDVTLPAPGKTASFQLNIPTQQMSYSVSVTISAPKLQKTETIMAAAVDVNGNDYFPTDVKTLKSESQVALNVQPSGGQLLSILKNSQEVSFGPGSERASSSIEALKNRASPSLFPLLPNPKASAWHNVQSTLPTANTPELKKLTPIGALAVLNMVTYTKSTKGKILNEDLFPVWHVHAQNWTTTFRIPALGMWEPKVPTKRWTVSYYSAPASTAASFAPATKATHATTTCVDFN